MNKLEEAKNFIYKYNKIFDTGNMEEFSKLFCEPFISVRADGSIANMPTNEIACEFFKTVYKTWQNEGYETFTTKDFEVIEIGNNSMLVTFTWEMLDKNQNLIKEWRQSYNLLRDKENWKVVTSTFHS